MTITDAVLQFVENGPAFFEGAYISEDLFQNIAGIRGILSDTIAGVGVGAYGDDLAAQLLEPADNIRGGQESAAAVHTAGIHLHTLPLSGQFPQDLVDQLPVLLIGNRPGCRMAMGLAI